MKNPFHNRFRRRAKSPRDVQEETQLYTFGHYCPSADVRPVGYQIPRKVAESRENNRCDCEAFLDRAGFDEYNHSYRLPMLSALHRLAVASLNSQRLDRERIIRRLGNAWKEDLIRIEHEERHVDEALDEAEARLALLRSIHSRGTIFEETYKK